MTLVAWSACAVLAVALSIRPALRVWRQNLAYEPLPERRFYLISGVFGLSCAILAGIIARWPESAVSIGVAVCVMIAQFIVYVRRHGTIFTKPYEEPLDTNSVGGNSRHERPM
jgi:hypothetical protein